MPSPVAVSVLVPVLDEGRTIRSTVEAMLEQDVDGGFELLFADGRSSDDTRAQLEALAARDPRIRVLDNPRRGTAAGLNVCLRAARGEFVARMDAHAFYPPGYLRLGVERLRRGGAGWVAGPQLAEGRGLVSRAVVAALGSPLGRGGSRKWAPQADPEAEFDLDTGVFCGVWRREDLLAHGGFDEDWPRNQDSELAARFLRSGERIVCLPAMGARYLPRDTLRGLWRQYHQYGQYRARTARRHPTSLRRSALLPALLVLDAAAAAQTMRAGRPAEAAALPLVLATMHAANGSGFLRGAARWGVPWRALAGAAGLRADPADAGPYAGPVAAPSLTGDNCA
jgi:glycosyltransferase involved in cell wall biosynthesis